MPDSPAAAARGLIRTKHAATIDLSEANLLQLDQRYPSGHWSHNGLLVEAVSMPSRRSRRASSALIVGRSETEPLPSCDTVLSALRITNHESLLFPDAQIAAGHFRRHGKA